MQTLARLGLAVLERGWLSSNVLLFDSGAGAPATVVDTGYASHAEQTCAWLQARLARPGAGHLGRVVNTHLHSDHCGGNAAIQTRWNVDTCVPAASFAVAAAWHEHGLSYAATSQRCDRFRVDTALEPGTTLQLGPSHWQVWAAPGHDPQAVMLFEPTERVLISADALWEQRVAILFPELEGEDGVGPALASLDCIERLAPAVVIPGHGRIFTDVADAIAGARRRIRQFGEHPERHLDYAQRALVMFHMLEVGTCERAELQAWVIAAPFFGRSLRRVDPGADLAAAADGVIERLLASDALRRSGSQLRVAAQ